MKTLEFLGMAAVVLASLAFSGCDSSTSSGNGNGGNSSNGNGGGAAGSGNSVTENDDGGRVLTAEEKNLVGVWVPRPEYAIDYAGGIEFKADGTFLCVINDFSGPVRGVITKKGYFKMRGDEITCTRVLESWTEQSGYQGRNYTDKVIADEVWKFYYSTTASNDVIERLYPRLTWLVINMLPDPNLMDWFTKSTENNN